MINRTAHNRPDEFSGEKFTILSYEFLKNIELSDMCKVSFGRPVGESRLFGILYWNHLMYTYTDEFSQISCTEFSKKTIKLFFMKRKNVNISNVYYKVFRNNSFENDKHAVSVCV